MQSSMHLVLKSRLSETEIREEIGQGNVTLCTLTLSIQSGTQTDLTMDREENSKLHTCSGTLTGDWYTYCVMKNYHLYCMPMENPSPAKESSSKHNPDLNNESYDELDAESLMEGIIDDDDYQFELRVEGSISDENNEEGENSSQE